MKEEISSLELYYAVKEFQDIIGGRIDKIYQYKRDFTLTMHVSGKGRKLLKITPNIVYLTNYKEEFPSEPPGFCKFLRKYLGNTTIKRIEQIGFERIIEITFESKENKFYLIVEIFGNGNVILCDENHKVMSALESHKWKDRIVRGGIEYEYPPEKINLLTVEKEELKQVIDSSKKDSIVKTLAVNIGLGGIYAEELCIISKIEKTKSKLSLQDISVLYKILKSLLRKKIKANTVDNEVLPFELEFFKNRKKIFYASFNEAMDAELSKAIKEKQVSDVNQVKNKELERINIILQQQQTTIDGLEKSSEENQRKGEFIYEHYEEVKKILDDINKAREKFSWNEIKEKLKGHKVVKQINEKEGKITIEI